jgi:proteasome alpha subunit
MPFYVSPEQAMKDKADYARKAITRIRSGVVIACDAGILFVAPNPSRALRKFSEIYDRIAFAAVGRYNEFENLRKAGVRFADMTGFQYDRQDVSARGLANWYAQLLGTIFTDSPKPYEVEIVVAEVGKTVDGDQIYRITFDGSVADERGFVVIGGQADQVAAVLKDQYSDGMTLSEAFGVAIRALAGQGDGDRQDITATQLEVALLDRGREHRAFRRLTGPRLEGLLAEALPGRKTEAITDGGGADAGAGSTGVGPAGGTGTEPGGAAEPPGADPA